MFRRFSRTLELVVSFSSREIEGRYRFSFLGLIWLVAVPVIMLVMFAFVFSVIFQARWPNIEIESRSAFAVILFVGLATHSFVSEAITRAPSAIVANAGLICRTAVPPEVPPLSAFLVALIGFVLNALVILVAYLVVFWPGSWTGVLAVPAALPMLPLVLGLVLLLAAGGVYVRDLVHLIGPVSMALLFLCPIFYSLENVPESMRDALLFNPLTIPVLNMRAALFGTEGAGVMLTMLHTVCSVLVMGIGAGAFLALKRGFDDRL
ncbi:ABC transporter permease [Marinicauda algicola]|nr:ABC transporter permease [Marinicauda algicola]